MAQDPAPQKRSAMGSILLVTGIFVLVIGLATWAAYTFGEGHIVIDGRDISDLEPWEVAGGIIAGIIGLIIGLTFGVLGLLIGLIATVFSIVLAIAGIAVGLFISVGVFLGPFLLLAAIIILIRRQKDQKVD